MKFPMKPVQHSQHSLMVLLHYLVKCVTHYDCTVNNMIDSLYKLTVHWFRVIMNK